MESSLWIARHDSALNTTEVSLLASLKGSDARATLRAAIGDAEDDGRGFSVSLNFVHKGNGKRKPLAADLPPPFLFHQASGPWYAAVLSWVGNCLCVFGAASRLCSYRARSAEKKAVFLRRSGERAETPDAHRRALGGGATPNFHTVMFSLPSPGLLIWPGAAAWLVCRWRD